MRGAISGGIFIGVFNIFEIYWTKKQLQMENNMMQAQLRASYVDQIAQLKQMNPKLVTCTDEEFEKMVKRSKIERAMLQGGGGMF